MKYMKSCSLCLLIGVFLLQNSFSQSSNKRFTQWLVNDPVSFARDFGSDQLLGLGIAGLNLGVLTGLDEQNSSYLQREFRSSSYLKVVNEFGTFKYVAPASGLLFGATLLTKDEKLQDAAFTSFQAVLNTAVTVNISKFMFARSRPYENDGVHDFDFFHPGETSFPSGHSSTAFALVTPWVMYYPGPATYALMAIPVGTALARISYGKHWLTDVSAGALIGGYWGYYLSKKHLGTRSSDVEITPFFKGDGGGLTLNIPIK